MSGTTAAATTMNGHLQEANDLSKLPNRVADMLAGRAILITGGTGFMGKVLIEKILRTCSDVDTIYVLIRAKKGKEPRHRIEELFASPVSEFNKKKQQVLSTIVLMLDVITSFNF
jgi:fatty acyl-CoA reductase